MLISSSGFEGVAYVETIVLDGFVCSLPPSHSFISQRELSQVEESAVRNQYVGRCVVRMFRVPSAQQQMERIS